MRINRFGKFSAALFVVGLVLAISTVAQACCFCDHREYVTATGWGTVFTPKDSEYHWTQKHLMGDCSKCGIENIYSCKDKNPSIQQWTHTIYNGRCGWCGYEETSVCPHTNQTAYYSSSKPIYSIVDRTCHDVLYDYEIVCNDCGAKTGETGRFKAATENHTFTNA